jgi:peptidyl-prolyl cis-trans isomerase B (cyclophilin B)
MRLLPALLLTAALALTACGGDDEKADAGRGAPTGAATPADITCSYTDPGYDATKPAETPPAKPSVGGDVKITMKTTIGDFHLTLDAAQAPCTVNSFVSLTEQGWYDGSFCQRLTLSKESGIGVLQCGDPSGTGQSAPGYVFGDELTGLKQDDTNYPPGTVAMANAGPNTNAAQFFLVYDDTPLPPSYTVFGTFDDAGVKLIEDLAAKGTTFANGFTAPAEEVKVSQMVFG